MTPTSSDDGASAAFGTSGRTRDGIFQVPAEFDHTTLIEEGFYAENEKSFLSAVNATRICSEPLKRGVCRRLESGEPLSHLEQLPYEIVMSVLEQINISSLVAVASVNTHVRNFVQALPDLTKIQRSIYSSRAISRMYTTGTAKNFNLKHFMQVFSSSSRGVFNEGDKFAVTFCLMRCYRVCQDFRVLGPHQRCLPTEMAIECFGLEYQEMVHSKRSCPSTNTACWPAPGRWLSAGNSGEVLPRQCHIS